MNRQYYKTTTYETPTKSSNGIKCFRCGGPRKIAACPEKQPPAKKEQNHCAEEAAPFVCFTEEAYVARSAESSSAKTTEEAIRLGYGIVDGGATKTLGSVHALEALVSENEKKHQDGRVLEVDVRNKPTFGFGNSSRDRCLSTTKMKITNNRDGALTIHTLDKGEGPVLLSIEAVIDFEADLIVLRALDDKKAIRAERSQAGHQLIPLTEDLYSNSLECHTAVRIGFAHFAKVRDNSSLICCLTKKGRASKCFRHPGSRNHMFVTRTVGTVGVIFVFLGKTKNTRRNNAQSGSHSAAAITVKTVILFFPFVLTPQLAMPAIQSLKKPELIAAIRELGEEPPTKWHIPELRVRLQQLEEEHGIERRKGKAKTNLQQWMQRLSQASKKKLSLSAFCKDELEMTLTGNETMIQMEKMATEKIYTISLPNGEDPMGFGQHANLSYYEVLDQHPSYAEWAVCTMKEGGCLARFGH